MEKEFVPGLSLHNICSMRTYIYILQDPETMEVRYVGKTNNPERRKRSHLWRYCKNKSHCYKWVNSLLKKQMSPIFNIIDEVVGDWEWLEIYWIEQFKNWGFKLTNITKGGEGSYGGGKWLNKPVTAFNFQGKVIKVFDSQKECAKYFKSTQSNVKQSVNGRNLTFLKKYILKSGKNYKNIPPFNYQRKYIKKVKEWNNSKSIVCIEDGIEFKSLKKASEYYKIGVTSISNNLKNKSKKLRNGKSFKYSESVRPL